MNWDATIHTYIFTQTHTLTIHPLIRASRYPQNVIKNHKDINILIGSERMFLLIFVQSFRNVSTLTVFTHTHPRTYTKHDMSILDHSSVHPFTHSPNRPFNHVWWRQTTYIHIHTSGAVKRCRQWSSLVFTFVQDKQMSYTVMYIFIFTPNGMYLYHRFRTKKTRQKNQHLYVHFIWTPIWLRWSSIFLPFHCTLTQMMGFNSFGINADPILAYEHMYTTTHTNMHI